jgi:excisionase family DNA binding protein
MTPPTSPQLSQTAVAHSIPRGALKLKDAAQYLSVSPITIRRWIERGLIKPNRASRHIIISVLELDRFLADTQL